MRGLGSFLSFCGLSLQLDLGRDNTVELQWLEH